MEFPPPAMPFLLAHGMSIELYAAAWLGIRTLAMPPTTTFRSLQLPSRVLSVQSSIWADTDFFLLHGLYFL